MLEKILPHNFAALVKSSMKYRITGKYNFYKLLLGKSTNLIEIDNVLSCLKLGANHLTISIFTIIS
jgi:hypothetical protein